MPSNEACLLDSNILLRIGKSDEIQHAAINKAILHLFGQGIRLCYTSQTLGEYWNAATRPREKKKWFRLEHRGNRSLGPRSRAGLRVFAGQPGSPRALAISPRCAQY